MSSSAVEALPAIIAALCIAAVVSYLLTPLAIRFAPRLGAIDVPADARRVHREPIPRTGGLAVAATFVGVGVAGIIGNEIFHFATLRSVRVPEVYALFAGVAVGGLLGYLDDRLQLRARWQFVFQFALAAIVLLADIRITRLPNPFGESFVLEGFPIAEAAAVAVTMLWIMGMINSANFVDGLDGLLAGIALIAAATLGLISLVDPSNPQPLVALLCALLAGSLLGFLPYNFHPARVFIGTAGVFAVGYALALLSVLGTAKVAIALLVLGVPVIDAFWIIIRRVSSGRSPFSADRGHFHHRLLDLGLSHRQAVLMIYGICLVLAVLSLALSGRGQISAFLVIVLGGGLALYLMTRRAGRSLERESYPEDTEVGADADQTSIPDERQPNAPRSEFRRHSQERA